MKYWKAYTLALGFMLLVGAATTVPSQLWFKATGTGAVLRKQSDKLGDVVSITDFGAKCDDSTDDTAAIQAAINATVAGGSLLIPAGTAGCVVCTGLPLTITKSILIQGQSGFAIQTHSAIQACPSLNASTDVILVQAPSGQVINVKFADLSILPQTGTPGRYGIKFDGSLGEINQSVLDHVYFGQFGTAAMRGEGSGLANGTPAATLLKNVYIAGGGISFSNTGDSVKIRDSTITGPGTLDIAFLQGASLLEFQGNYISNDGGIHIGASATAVMFWGNELQTQSTFTGSNGAVIDIDGTVGNHAVDSFLGMNSFQVVSGITANAIRVNYADRTQIWANRFGRGATTSKDIVITANASDTMIGQNSWANGGPFTSMVSDSGTRTTFFSPYPASNIWVVPNNKGIGALDDAGTARSMLQTYADGSVQLNGYHGAVAVASANGVSYLYDSNGNLGVAISSAVSTAPTASAVASVQGLAVRGGIAKDQAGYKHLRGTAGCTTAAAAGANCTTTITWTTAFADSSYTVTCQGSVASAGVPVLGPLTSKTASAIVIQTIAVTAVAATFGTIECEAVHD